MTQVTRKVMTLESNIISTDGLEWNKYRKRPVAVSAVQMDIPFKVETLEGWSQGQSGDWLVEGVLGELYPCNDAVFCASYESVEVHTESHDWTLALINERFSTDYGSWDEVDRAQLTFMLGICLGELGL